MHQLRVLDLFCGAGGMSWGFSQAGMQVVLGIDQDASALRTFTANHRDSAALQADLTQVDYQRDVAPHLGEVPLDVIVGGPPCQGMSVAGLRQSNDPRNQLYRSYLRLVAQARPRACVLENVPGMLTLFGGQIRDALLTDFAALGYRVTYQILNAADYGVPQNRRRVFFVALRADVVGEFTFPARTGEMVSCAQAISDLRALVDDYGAEEVDYVASATTPYQRTMRAQSSQLFNHVATCHSEQVKQTIALVPDGGNYKNLPPELRETRKFNVAWTRFASDKPAPTIDTGHRHHFHYCHNRVPTVRECARLQSFPDHFRFWGSRTAQMRQVGNAVPPLLAQALATQLRTLLERDTDVEEVPHG